MDVLGMILGGGDLRATYGPADDYWYQPVGTMTEAGIVVDAEQAKKISAWYRGREILACTLAMLPLQVMRRLPNDGGAEPAPDHPLYDVLHDEPNEGQDAYMWKRQQMYHVIDHGNGINRNIAGARGPFSQLQPIDPRLVTAKRIGTSWRVVYTIRHPTGALPAETATQDEIFHLCGSSDNGYWGKGILEYARTSLGTASATESYAAGVFGKGTMNGGVIEVPGTLDGGASRRMALSFVTAAKEWHLPKVLEQGSKWNPNEMTPEDAQMLLSRKHSVDDIARWLGIPRMMLENSDPSFGNGEQFTQNFLDINMGGWLATWEFAINRQLILNRDKYFARINRNAIVRSNYKDRVDGSVALVNGGIISVDEARAIDDLPKRGGKADELREPQNITGKPLAPSSKPAPKATPPADDETQAMLLKAQAITVASAERLLRKEIAAVQRAVVRHAADESAFVEAVTAFYAGHVALVMGTLQMAQAEAETYCAGQAHQLVNGAWLSALELWQTAAYASGVAAIALEDAA